jgi:hypothetical protein
MFSRSACYFFVRPKRTYLEVCIFLARRVKAPQIRRVEPASQSKFVHFLRVRHRDEVEAPMTGWLREAYEVSPVVSGQRAAARRKAMPRPSLGRSTRKVPSAHLRRKRARS